MARLVETVLQESAPERIDAESGILYGVKLLGEHSANGRRYKPDAMKRAVPLYNERKGYGNHPGKKELNEDRKLQDWTTVFRSPRYVEGSGIHADAHLLKSDPLFPKIIEAAQRFPKSIGFSHVADGEFRRENGIEIVESINEVFSVDLVSDPATTNGFFESKQQMPKTLAEFIDSIPQDTPQRARLIEAATAAFPLMPGQKADDPQSQIMLAFQSMLNVVLEVLRATMETKNTTTDDAAKKAAEAEAAKKAAAEKEKQPDPPVPPTLEAMQRRLDLADAKAMLLESGRASKDEKVRALQIETLADAKADKRPALLESWPKAGEQKLRESRPFERPNSSPPANGGTDRDAASLKAYESRFEESAKGARERIAKRRAG